MRNLIGLLPLLLVACGGGGEQTTATADVPAADRIECALGGSETFVTDCAIERSDDASVFTIRHPNGGFRRLSITSDGRGVVAADGAATANVQIVADKRIEVTVDRDRYRLPATVKGR